MKRLMILTLALVTFGALLGPVPASVAEETRALLAASARGATAETVGSRAAELFAELTGVLDDAQRYRGLMARASREDSLVLAVQYLGTQKAFVDVMQQLRTLFETAAETPELQARLLAIHQELTPYLASRIEDLRAEIDDLRARRTTTAPADLAELEVGIYRATERLDLAFAFTREHLEALQSLGEDTQEERAAFHALLRSRADELSGRLSLSVERAAEIKHYLKTNPADADLALRQEANRQSIEVDSASFRATLALMDAEGIPDQAFQTQLVELTQDLASGIFNVQVASTLLQKGWNALLNWIDTQGPGYLAKLFLAAVILLVGWVVARLVRKAVNTALRSNKINISQLLHRTIVNFAHKVILGLTLMVVLSQFGFSLGPLLAGLGVVGFILGFAMQDSLSNFASGLMILFYRPYDVGDLVEISGVFGKVEHMSMVSTSVLTLDNQKLVVPNSKIWGDVIKNVTDQKVRRVDMVFGISYSDDIPHAEKVLTEILAGSDRVLENPEPMVRLHTLNDSSVDFIVRPWVKTEDYWEVYWEVTRAVKMRFDAEKICIPFPQRDVHLHQAAKAVG